MSARDLSPVYMTAIIAAALSGTITFKTCVEMHGRPSPCVDRATKITAYNDDVQCSNPRHRLVIEGDLARCVCEREAGAP